MEQHQKPMLGGALSEGSVFPSVDIFIPIFSEPLSILESTVVAATQMDYPNKKVFVCDDSHQNSVKELAEKFGAFYIKGPKRHAKAGNMNNALKMTNGELVVIFDTDHIPASSFLRETVPFFTDSKMGFVQTPHHFYNQDIFQRSFLTGERMANEQDMFNHAIQSSRNAWGGSFFVGSGAVFRRLAIQDLGGFLTMSITEDIHTSQHLHAKGWHSQFVDQDLAYGLTAENLSSYLVQRRRWMLGCLQIFFKDNPLFLRGLGARHKIGYFASLYYFFFPAARVIFLLTPLSYLVFYAHPLFADLPTLLSYMVPYLIALPMLSAALLPGWPRMFWGTMYEQAVAFPLARSMFDLFLPKSLGFKVTPKGIVSSRRAFDFSSSKLTLIALGLTIFGVAKGIGEFHYFHIERDAYFFNLGWALINLMSLCMALTVAWERPQRRSQERVQRKIPIQLKRGETAIEIETEDISTTGVAFVMTSYREFPSRADIKIFDIRLEAELVYNDQRRKGEYRVAYRFTAISEWARLELMKILFTDARAWGRVHTLHAKSNVGMGIEYFKALGRVFLSDKVRRRKEPREVHRVRAKLQILDSAESAQQKDHGSNLRVLLVDRSRSGFGCLGFGPLKPRVSQEFECRNIGGGQFRVIWIKDYLNYFWRAGLSRVETLAMENAVNESVDLEKTVLIST